MKVKDKSLKILKGILPYLIAILAGLYLAELVTGALMGISKYKMTFTEHLPAFLKQLAIYPFHYYGLYLSQRNPALIIISVAVILYIAYFALKRQSKHKQWETADTDTHGSATWGTVKELQGRYFTIKQGDLINTFTQATNQEIIERLQQKGDSK